MTCNLYRNASDTTVVDKSLTTIASGITFYLLDESSIDHPRLHLEFSSGYLSCNYIYISDFGKYYYAKITVETDDVMLAECDVDALMTRKDAIKASEQIVTRTSQDGIYNSMLQDNLFQAEMKQQIQQKIIPNDVFNTHTWTDLTKNFVVTVVGDGTNVEP